MDSFPMICVSINSDAAIAHCPKRLGLDGFAHLENGCRKISLFARSSA